MMGKQDVMFAGGGEELDWTLSCLFDAMGAMSSKYNDTPEKASRAFDQDRDGFVISGGGGIVVLEDLEHALARGAKIYAEVTGFAATSDGHDMVAPSGEGGERAMRLALQTLPEGRKVSYINAHGTSTPVGDVGEVEAARRVFGAGNVPPISSTKSMTGHAQGAAGALEAIFCLLMLDNDFITPSINVDTLAEGIEEGEVAQYVENAGRQCHDQQLRLWWHQRVHGSEQVQGLTTAGVLAGKRGLIMGVATTAPSLGIAKAMHEAGAELAFTYQGEALANVWSRSRPLWAAISWWMWMSPMMPRSTPRSNS